MGKSKKKGGSSAVEDDFEVIEKTELLDDEATATEGQGSKKAAGKKGRKAKKEAELEEAQKELEALNDDPECEVPAAQTTTAKSGKKGTKKAKAVAKDDPSDHEDSDEGEGSGKSKAKKGGFALLMEGDDSPAEDSQSDEEENKPAKKAAPKKSAKPAKKSAFELMAEMEGDSNDDDQGSDQDNESKEDKKKAGEKKSNKKDKKKKGKTNKKDGGDEDELAAALADLGIEAGAEEDEKAKKKKEKKAKQKQKQVEAGEDGEGEAPSEAVAEEGTGASKKSKKKKKGGKDEAQTGGAGEEAKEPEAESAADGKKKAGKKGPGSKMKEALKEALKKQQEEEERLRQEEEEKQRKAEEAEKARLEKKRLEAEEKERKKQAKKDRIDEMKRQGTYLTPKQREEKARNEAFLAAMKAQGLEVPNKDEKKGPRLGTRVRGPKNWKGKSETPEPDTKAEDDTKKKEEVVKVEIVDESKKVDAKGEESDEVADAWDASSDESDTEDKKESEVETKEVKTDVKNEASQNAKEAAESDDEDSESEDESDDDEEEDESDSDDESEDEEDKAQIAMNRIARRREANEKARTTDDLRAPVVCVLGHVDTGKTKILDKLRRTNVQDGEAGGITQQIGATNVPKEVIQEQCKMVKGFPGIKVPGLLIIDTPGHESFSNLRDRGSSLCDIAILVVDIMHGLEPQTIESINLLKKKKTPFVIALNKVDRLYQWKSNRHKDIQDVVTSQEKNTILEFKKRSNEVIASIAEQGLNAALCYENPDPKSYISMVPTSAHSGEGMGNLMGLLVTLSQTRLAQRLAYSEELQATVLEVKAIPGYGTTIDICLVNGRLKEGATMILAGTEGPVVTSAKALLTPAKMQDLRVKNNYVEHKEIRAAQGVKIVAKELDKAIAGLNLLVANHPDEVQICKDEIAARLSSAINSIKVKDRGVFVQASTLGSLEALLEFLRTSKIPYAGVKIGPVVKKDVMKASVMLEHEPKYTIILAFDVKVEKDAQEMADKEGVKIFQADIIYHLFDRFVAYQDELKAKKKEEFRNVAVFPCKLKMMPNCIFNSRDPIVAGVIVEGGIVRTGTPLCVPSKDFVEIGVITSIQSNHKEQETARKGEEVCIKVEPVPGEAPKMFGRHFDENDMVVSKISRTSIDACKEYFRDDLQKSDWQLMIELKKTFEIL